MDYRKTMESLSENDVFLILRDLGYTGGFRHSAQGWRMTTQLCHGGSGYNLGYCRRTKRFRCFSGCNSSFSLFDLVMKARQCSFPDAVRYVSWRVGEAEAEKAEQELIEAEEDAGPQALQAFEEALVRLPYAPWLREGITREVQSFFGVAFAPGAGRVVVPHYDWKSGALLGYWGRTAARRYAQLGIAKWYPVTQFNPKHNLFGFSSQCGEIADAGEIIVAESEKSPMLARCMGIGNVCAVSGHNLSEEQAAALMEIGMPVVLAFDKDVAQPEVCRAAERIADGLPVSAVPSWNAPELDEKDSPLDRGRAVWDALYHRRVILKGEQTFEKNHLIEIGAGNRCRCHAQ